MAPGSSQIPSGKCCQSRLPGVSLMLLYILTIRWRKSCLHTLDAKTFTIRTHFDTIFWSALSSTRWTIFVQRSICKAVDIPSVTAGDLFVWLCFALLCFALLCFALLCFALFCFSLLPFDLLCFALLCFDLLCYALQFPTPPGPPAALQVPLRMLLWSFDCA